jgi:hypothetical protein
MSAKPSRHPQPVTFRVRREAVTSSTPDASIGLHLTVDGGKHLSFTLTRDQALCLSGELEVAAQKWEARKP